MGDPKAIVWSRVAIVAPFARAKENDWQENKRVLRRALSADVAVHAILTPREENPGISNIEQGVQKEERPVVMVMGQIAVDDSMQSRSFHVVAHIQVGIGLFPSAFCGSLFDILRFVFFVKCEFS